MTSHKATAMFVLASPILNAGRNRIVELAGKYRLPAIYEWPETADVGGMMAYGSEPGRPFAPSHLVRRTDSKRHKAC